MRYLNGRNQVTDAVYHSKPGSQNRHKNDILRKFACFALDAMNKINERKKYEKSNLTLKNDYLIGWQIACDLISHQAGNFI